MLALVLRNRLLLKTHKGPCDYSSKNIQLYLVECVNELFGQKHCNIFDTNVFRVYVCGL